MIQLPPFFIIFHTMKCFTMKKQRATTHSSLFCYIAYTKCICVLNYYHFIINCALNLRYCDPDGGTNMCDSESDATGCSDDDLSRTWRHKLSRVGDEDTAAQNRRGLRVIQLPPFS